MCQDQIFVNLFMLLLNQFPPNILVHAQYNTCTLTVHVYRYIINILLNFFFHNFTMIIPCILYIQILCIYILINMISVKSRKFLSCRRTKVSFLKSFIPFFLSILTVATFTTQYQMTE